MSSKVIPFGNKEQITRTQSRSSSPTLAEQQKKTFKLILPGSKLDLNNKKKQGKKGNEVCLFKPIATMHHFDVGKIKLKLTNYYDNGKMNIFLDLDGFKGEIKYHKNLNSMLQGHIYQ